MSKEDGVLEGKQFPLEIRLTCAAAVRIAFILQAIETHIEDKDMAKALLCVNSGQSALFKLVMHLAVANKCDPAKTFEHWMDITLPLPTEEQLETKRRAERQPDGNPGSNLPS